jgi:Tfp pilus assembly protein PilN
MAWGGAVVTDFSTRPRRRLWRADTALTFAACAALVAAGLLFWQASADLDRRRKEVARAAREADEITERVRVVEGKRSPGDAVLAAQARETAEAPPPRIVEELSALLPADVRLQSLDLDYRERLVLDLHVVAQHAEAYDLFLARLAESKRFGDVVPGPENRQGELTASVRMSYRGLPP